MRMVEQFTLSKTGQMDDNEDGLLVTEHYAAVVDGATSQSQRLWDGRRAGQMAMRTILTAVHTLAADLDSIAAIDLVRSAIAREYHQRGVDEEMARQPIDRWTAALALYSRARHELWLVGDCHALILLPEGHLRKVDNPKRIDEVTSAVRGLVLEAELAQGKTLAELQEGDVGLSFIRPLLARQYLFQNTTHDSPYAYAAIDGFPVGLTGIKVVRLPREAHGLVLGSDGYPELHASLAATEASLRDMLAVDPLCIRRHATTKGLARGKVSYDDRSYLRLAFA